MSTLEEALRYKCPECGAFSGMPCVYMTDAFKITTEYDIAFGRRVDVKRQTQKIGEQTKRPHNGRLRRLWEVQRAADRTAWYAQRALELRDPYADERAAYMAFGNREQQDLKLWLHKFGRVLWE